MTTATNSTPQLSCNAAILRPTVIFGERNRGNVYNLMRLVFVGN